MEQPITWQLALMILSVGGGVVGAIFAMWWRIDTRIDKSKTEMLEALDDTKRDLHLAASAASAQANVALSQVAELRVHVAETYALKSGVREMGDRVMQGQDRVLDEMKHLRERVDRAIQTSAITNRGPR